MTLADLRMYDGNGRGVVTLDASSGQPSFTADVSLSGIAARPLLRDAAQVDWLAGNADVAWKVSGQRHDRGGDGAVAERHFQRRRGRWRRHRLRSRRRYQ